MREWRPIYTEAEHKLASPAAEQAGNRQFLWVILVLLLVTGVLVYLGEADTALASAHPGSHHLPTIRYPG